MFKKIVFLFSLLFLITGLAMAGTVDLPKTGQTTSYSAGDDGNLRVGVAWPEPRFTVNGDCVLDNLTGLMWAKNANLAGGRKTWQDALDYVASLNSGGVMGGYTDWRLPNVNELESLINAEQANFDTWLNSQGFINVQASNYWSSTTRVSSTGGAFIVGMSDPRVGPGSKASSFYVWPVRSDASPTDLPKTGQTTSYAAGDDGNLQEGVAWPEPRFSVSGDCVTDNLIGLMWTKNANLAGAAAATGTKTWQEALDYINSLNTGEGLGGYNDWRLPNRKELRSLINYGQADSATWLNSQGFISVQANDYWSSTTYASNTVSAWIVFMNCGIVHPLNKTSGFYVWPVRSGSFENSDISISPASHDFGNIILGSTSATQSFTITNNGTATLEISSMALTGEDGSMFGLATDSCPSIHPSIAQGESCTITSTFAPASEGEKSAILEITSNALDTPILNVSLSGTGIILSLVSLTTGLNIFGYPVNIPFEHTSYDLILNLGGANEVDKIQRYDPNIGIYETTTYDANGDPCGDEFDVVSGEGYLVYMKMDKSISFAKSIINPPILCKKGLNIISIPSPPNSYTSYDLLSYLGAPDEIAGIKKFNRGTGIFEATTYFYEQPSGVKFNIANGEAYLIHAKVAKDKAAP